MRSKIQDAIKEIKSTLKTAKGNIGAAGAEAKSLTKEDAKAAKEQEKSDYEGKLDEAHKHISGGK